MRQGQQNRRGRGRNRSGGGGGGGGKAHHNPLTRSFESNGPDVKIRGNPSHIAEKYMSLARDAQSSGDPVLAENYLQHAEHYNRIIMAFREQNQQSGGESMNGNGRHREGGEGEDFNEEDGDEGEGFSQPMRGHEQQPRHGGQHRFEDRQQRYSDDRPHRQHHEGRGPRERYQDRHSQNGERHQPAHAMAPQPQPQVASAEQPVVADQAPAPQREASPRRRERFSASAHEQPEFLRRPVRRPRREPVADAEATEASPAAVEGSDSDNSAA